MAWPAEFSARIQAQFSDGNALLEALDHSPQTSILTNLHKPGPTPSGTPVPWNSSGLVLPERPQFTYDPLFHAGVYYPQESSSMMVEHLVRHLRSHLPENPTVLDLCAAPGGKSLNVLNALDGNGVLLSNEVIRPRSAILAETLTKWGHNNILITQNDPKDFTPLEGVFDLIVVDAPCSGEGMFRKDPEAANHWSPEAVQLCAARQKRILGQILPCLAPGGFLIYATCTFNAQENDENVRWLQQQTDLKRALPEAPEVWGIVQDEVGWRFLPHRVQGEGLFISAWQKQDGRAARPISKKQRQRLPVPGKELTAIAQAQTRHSFFVEHRQLACALPAHGADLFQRSLECLNLIQVGTPVGTLKGRDILPEHAWSQSAVLNLPGQPVELSREAALNYLARQPFDAPSTKGWVRFTYQGHSLGLGKALGNRVNNYYPKYWRIRHLPA